MFQTDREKLPRFNMQVLLGFLLGIVASLGCLFFCIFLGMSLAFRQRWLFPALIALGLIAIGLVALRHVRESSYARGMIIALSLALLVDAVGGVVYLK